MTAMILKKSRFMHLEKTGGTWFAELCSKHLKLKQMRLMKWGHYRQDQMPGEGLFTFGFVRNPLDWYPALWCQWSHVFRLARIRKRRDWSKFTRRYPDSRLIEKDGANFHLWYWKFVERYPDGPMSARIDWYLKDADFIGRFENLVEDSIEALTLAGEKFNQQAVRRFGKVKVNAGGEDTRPDKPELGNVREDILSREKHLFEKFGYDD